MLITMKHFKNHHRPIKAKRIINIHHVKNSKTPNWNFDLDSHIKTIEKVIS